MEVEVQPKTSQCHEFYQWGGGPAACVTRMLVTKLDVKREAFFQDIF